MPRWTVLVAAALLAHGRAAPLARARAAPGAAPRVRARMCAPSPAARPAPLRRYRLSGIAVPYEAAAVQPGAPWWQDEAGDGVSDALREAIASRVGVGAELLVPADGGAPPPVTVVRRSLDARRSRRGGGGGGGGGTAAAAGPRYVYIVELALPPEVRLRACAQLEPLPAAAAPLPPPPAPAAAPPGAGAAAAAGGGGGGGAAAAAATAVPPPPAAAELRARVVIVGAGPAGLFAALTLADAGVTDVLVLERGQPVELRGRDIGRMMGRRQLLKDSNFCFGEGGAGTWSDGKLTTRIGRNSGAVRGVLAALVQHGAPPRILVDGKPHLGTDRLVRILRAARAHLLERGVRFRWGARVQGLHVVGGRVAGVHVAEAGEERAGAQSTVLAERVVLAVGHSARALLLSLQAAGVLLAPKPFAVGFRIEHPQGFVNDARLGAHAAAVASGALPAADYRLTWQPPASAAAAAASAPLQPRQRDAFSFCMCPGGQVVPTSVDPEHLCVNGMSFSRRQSGWANAAVVTQVGEDALAPHAAEGALAGLAFQREAEAAAAIMGGGGLVAPVQRASDFLAGAATAGADVPPSSYRLGVRPGRLDELYPAPIVASLRSALHAWEEQLPGFASHPAALLHGVETRTSCPTRVLRTERGLEAVGLGGLHPCGEGAGWAGGIVSAAVDGVRVARAVARLLGVQEDAMRGLARADDDDDDGGGAKAAAAAAVGKGEGKGGTTAQGAASGGERARPAGRRARRGKAPARGRRHSGAAPRRAGPKPPAAPPASAGGAAAAAPP